MKVLRMVISGQIARQRWMRSRVFSPLAGPLHQLEDARACVLERDVQVWQELAVRHQRHHLVHVRVRIDVVQAHPRAELGQPSHNAFIRVSYIAPAPAALGVLQVHAVGAGVLRDHQQFLDAAAHQLLGLAQHLVDRARHQVAAHRRDDAEAATVVAAFGNLQVRVVPRRRASARRRRHQVHEGIVLRRLLRVHRVHHRLA
jgi:hypothetical protein